MLFRGLTGPLQGVQWLKNPVDQAAVQQQGEAQRQHGSADLNGECDSGLRYLRVGTAGSQQDPVETKVTAPWRRLQQEGSVLVAEELRLRCVPWRLLDPVQQVR